MPIIRELLQSVKKALSERGICGAVMIVRSDGTLVGEEQAMRKPIETLLSGPAASIIGATFLSGEKDALVLDMGGTTTDIAILRDGSPRVSEDGAKVGGWCTHVRAAAINTFGLGGDSWLQLDMARRFQVGPQRVVPICVAAHQYSHLIEELKAIDIPQAYLLLHAQVTDCFFLLNENVTAKLSDKERQVAGILRDAPHSYIYISEATRTEINLLNLDHLVSTGVLGRISVTPTDILHARGELAMWDAKAAKIAVTMLARRFRMDMGEFIEFAIGKITDELSYTCLQSLAEHDGAGFDMKADATARYFLDKCVRPPENDLMRCSMVPQVPVIGIGAPVASWLPRMAERLGARLIIPSGSEVANAIGSATGRVMESVKILIHPGKMGVGFEMHSALEHRSFDTLEEAAGYALKQAEAAAREAAYENGVDEPEVTLCRDDRYAEASAGDRIYIESRIEAIATECPEWERNASKDNFFVDTRDRGMTL
jgi:N-methylhydantoinase A/oxoprolinase/acetone carboxylase beta subunit